MKSPSKSGSANENKEKLSLLHRIYSRWAGVSRKNRNLYKNIETSFHFFFKKLYPEQLKRWTEYLQGKSSL